MSTVTWGVVKEGKILPAQPLPEGAAVQITLLDAPLEMPAELQEELDAWSLASAQALDLIEGLAEEGEGADEKR